MSSTPTNCLDWKAFKSHSACL